MLAAESPASFIAWVVFHGLRTATRPVTPCSIVSVKAPARRAMTEYGKLAGKPESKWLFPSFGEQGHLTRQHFARELKELEIALADPDRADEMDKLVERFGVHEIFLTHHHPDHRERANRIAQRFDVPMGMSGDTRARTIALPCTGSAAVAIFMRWRDSWRVCQAISPASCRMK